MGKHYCYSLIIIFKFKIKLNKSLQFKYYTCISCYKKNSKPNLTDERTQTMS